MYTEINDVGVTFRGRSETLQVRGEEEAEEKEERKERPINRRGRLLKENKMTCEQEMKAEMKKKKNTMP